MYQPLKGQAENSKPPISRSMLETAGKPYHFRPRSLNHSNLPGYNRVRQPARPPLPDAGRGMEEVTLLPATRLKDM